MNGKIKFPRQLFNNPRNPRSFRASVKKRLHVLLAQCERQADGSYILPGTTFRMQLIEDGKRLLEIHDDAC